MALSYKIENLIEELHGACHYDDKQLFCCVIDKRDGAEIDATAADIDSLKIMLMVLVKNIRDKTGESPKSIVKEAIKVAKKCKLFDKKAGEEYE